MLEPVSKIPDGVRYYYGAEARLRRAVEDRFMAVAAGWSYEEIATPSIDYYALFERGMGRREASRAFRFADADNLLLALRPDVTSSVARAAATLLAKRPRPLRVCYAAPVFRRQPKTQAEWRRESKQLGCELLGAAGGAADMEMLLIIAEFLTTLKLQTYYRITLSNVGVFQGVAERLALDAAGREEMRRLIDIRDAAELERFLARHASDASDCRAFARLIQLSGKGEILAEARRVITNARSVLAIDALEELWRVVETLGMTDDFEIDLGDVAELDYYTGLIFKVYVSGVGTRVGGGGRYDNLTAQFGRAEAATGFVLDLDLLSDALARRGIRLESQTDEEPTRVAGDDLGALFLEATRRRSASTRVRVDFAD